MKKVVLVVVAVAAIAAAGYVILSRTRVGKPTVREDSKHWAMLSMAGFYQCPYCKKKVKLTDEQLQSKEPPALVCPYCNKAVDIVEVMTGKPAGEKTPPGGKR